MTNNPPIAASALSQATSIHSTAAPSTTSIKAAQPTSSSIIPIGLMTPAGSTASSTSNLPGLKNSFSTDDMTPRAASELDGMENVGPEDFDDSDADDTPRSDKRSGRRKIRIEYIEDKSRRHITFSKRKAGIMKKAYELSTLTGTQVLLLVASETGHVYTFATPKLQPLITKPEGKNLIQACLNAPDQLSDLVAGLSDSPRGFSRESCSPVPELSGALSVEHQYREEQKAAAAAAAAATMNGQVSANAYGGMHPSSYSPYNNGALSASQYQGVAYMNAAAAAQYPQYAPTAHPMSSQAAYMHPYWTTSGPSAQGGNNSQGGGHAQSQHGRSSVPHSSMGANSTVSGSSGGHYQQQSQSSMNPQLNQGVNPQ